MLITCKCLNVSIDMKNCRNNFLSVDIDSLNLSQAEKSESFFKEELKEIEIAQVTKQIQSLVQVKFAGIWVIEYCLNCSTNCFSTSSDKATALVNAALIADTDAISRIKTYKDYSPVFKIIVKPLVTKKNSDITELKQSSQKIKIALTSLQQQLNEAIQEQVTKTEEKIRIYTEQQYNQLQEFRDRAAKDHKALMEKIYESHPQIVKETNNSIVGKYELIPVETATAMTNKKVQNRRKTDAFVFEPSQISEPKGRAGSNRTVNLFARNSNATCHSLDSEGLFVLEGMEDLVVNEPGHSEGDSDTDHDDSGSHDEGIDVHRKKTSSFQLAKSLPVNVPVYSVPSTDFDKDDESLNAVDIAASIKALARSIHGDAVFGDLPRPRFSTQI